MFPRCNSTLSSYLKNASLPASLKNARLPGNLKNPGLPASLKNASLPASIKNPGLPESLKNPRLSAYLKNPRLRTRASVAVAVAAAAAGVGAASATAGAAPWSAPLNSMVVGIHTGSHATGQQAASAAQSRSGHAQLTDRQHSASGGTGKSQAPALQAVRALPVAHQKAAVPAKAAAPPKPAAPAQPYTVYDSVSPTSIPAGQQVATYANGSYQASWSELHGRHNVLWIDTNGSDPGCNALDVEPGDATPSGAAQWVKDRLTQQPHATAIVYTMISDWQQVKDAIGTLPGQMQSQVQYWIADPTGVPHIVPGSTATQWSWGPSYDVTMALPQFNQ